SIVITKSDKGRATVIMDRADYHQKCVDLLNDKATYKEIKQDPTKSLEKKVNNYVLQLKKKEAITQSTWRYLHATGSQIPRFYGLPKVHKNSVPLRPIVSFINSPTYNLSKFVSKLLSKS